MEGNIPNNTACKLKGSVDDDKTYNIPELCRPVLKKSLRDNAPNTINLVATLYISVTAFSHQVYVGVFPLHCL
jgi:hypothetical protein